MRRLSVENFDVAEVCNVLHGGGVVCLPTDTCYGIAVDATSDLAVHKMHQAKRRKLERAKSIAFSSTSMLEEWVVIDEVWNALNHFFLPGPLTLILPRKRKLAAGLNPDETRIATRIINHKVPSMLIEAFEKPITCTSANRQGESPLYCPDQIQSSFSDEIDILLDDGILPRVLPSTILDLIETPPILVRPGPISLENIYTVLLENQLYKAKTLLSSLALQSENILIPSKN